MIFKLLQNFLSSENNNDFNIIITNHIDTDEDDNSIHYVGRHFFIKNLFCELNIGESTNQIHFRGVCAGKKMAKM
ncbi:MAG TPA: hypothetical protein VJ697_14975 [Nitrososphaeraceae archaeon]|nr:hypothetical protein [Nitrososphaeraceae archaeon]